MLENLKSGDDFAARVYIVVKAGIFPWQTKALNYVWSMNEIKDVFWSSPYTANVMMKAVNSGKGSMGQWHQHKVNVLEDLRSAFGKDFDKIDGVAIMTDIDNSGKSATAYYGGISFSRE